MDPTRRIRSFQRIATFVFVVMALLGVASLASAGATFTVSGPTWNQPGYTWVATVTAMDNPDKLICMTINATTSPCSCVGVACATTGVGTWTCTQPTDVPNGTWSIASWSAGGGGSCGALKTPGASGTFGPTAVSLRSFSAGRTPPVQGFAAGAVVVSTLLGAGVFVRRRKGLTA